VKISLSNRHTGLHLFVMKILVDLRTFPNIFIEDAVSFGVECLYFIENENKEVELLFLCDQHIDRSVIDDPKKIIEKKSIRGKIGLKIWYDWMVPQIAKKHKADLFLSFQTSSASLKIPQCLWLSGDWENDPSKKNKKRSSYYLSTMNRSIQKADQVIVFSEYYKQHLSQRYQIDSAKINVIYAYAEPVYTPLMWTEKENTKIRYSGGKEYFIVTGIEKTEHIITALKAFSLFKKRQQSNMQLIVLGKNITADVGLDEKLETYKYRNDVHVLDVSSQLNMTTIIASAYALIHECHENEPPSPVLNAFASCVPVIASQTHSLQESVADAVLYSDTLNYELLASAMIDIYKDETLRSQLIEKGKIISAKFSQNQSCTQLMQTIAKAANNRKRNNYS
jgi:glycosyltransferase involved in cell wall biosynthesis